MHILLFGKNGQLGWELQRALAPLGKLTALSHDSTEYCGDFLNTKGVIETIRAIRPDVIVNAAGYTSVDLAETERNIARCINSECVELIAKEANDLGALFVHYSTDYVFDGSGIDKWSEFDAPDPINFYGKTKVLGEDAVQQFCEKYLIFRSSWIYSARGDNFIKKILDICENQEVVTVVNDQFGAPTGADLLADCTSHAIKMVLADTSKSGLYHVAAEGVTTWYDYATFIINKAKENKKMKVENIIGVSSASLNLKAERPLNSRFNTDKFKNNFNLVLPKWEDGVKRTLVELISK